MTNKIEEINPLRSSERRDLLIATAICPYGSLRSSEPFFRFYHRLPKRVSDGLKQLKSDDIKNDNWHIRR